MSRLAVARDDQIDAVYRESHRLWGAGLTLAGYRDLWNELSRTPWGSRYARFCVWTDDRGRVLSSLKLYRPRIRAGGATARATVVGAVFTPAALRGRGHARAMVQEAIERARRQGDLLVLLFSDIGAAYYESLGFAALPAAEQAGRLPGIPGPTRPGWRVRAMRDEDDPAVRRIHDEGCALRELAVQRDAEHWRFIRTRSAGYFERLAGRPLREQRKVVVADGEIVGYWIAVEGNGDWNLREIGVRGGAAGELADVFALGAHDARGRGLSGLYGWLPPELERFLDVRQVRTRPRKRAIPMLLGLARPTERLTPASAQASYLPYHDQF